MNRIKFFVLLFLLCALSPAAPAADTNPKAASEKNLCGWVDNPTPGNWWLTDSAGTWEISVQGGYEAEGTDNLPDFGANWVETNGHYGYGCACMKMAVDNDSKRVLSISHAKVLPISTCRKDPHLDQKDRGG